MGSRRRWVALLVGLVPGWGHVYWGREILGLALFTLAAIAVFAWLNGVVIYRGESRTALVWCAGVISLAAICGSWADLAWRTRGERVERELDQRQKHLAAGTAAYLHGDLDAAKDEFLACLRLDPQDIESLFRLGVVSARAGDVAGAKKWLRRTRRHDLEEKWSWEIEREFKRLRVDDAELKKVAPPAQEEEAEPTPA